MRVFIFYEEIKTRIDCRETCGTRKELDGIGTVQARLKLVKIDWTGWRMVWNGQLADEEKRTRKQYTYTKEY